MTPLVIRQGFLRVQKAMHITTNTIITPLLYISLLSTFPFNTIATPAPTDIGKLPLPQRQLFSKQSSAKMPQSYIITAKKDATPEQVKALKDKAKEQGGEITHEYTLIKGFAVTFPDDCVHTMADDPTVENVEKDQVVTTQ